MSARSFDINKINKKQSNIRVLNDHGHLSVVLHSTEVVKVIDNEVFLNTGGYKTVTTKTAINRALEQLGKPLKVYSKKGKWYVYNYYLKYDVEFNDNMKV